MRNSFASTVFGRCSGLLKGASRGSGSKLNHAAVSTVFALIAVCLMAAMVSVLLSESDLPRRRQGKVYLILSQRPQLSDVSTDSPLFPFFVSTWFFENKSFSRWFLLSVNDFPFFVAPLEYVSALVFAFQSPAVENEIHYEDFSLFPFGHGFHG